MSKIRKSLVDPQRLAPYDGDEDQQLIQVIIETPRLSRNKYALDSKRGIFELKKVLPAGMDFPYDFGFIPSTLAEDGDPLDVMLLMDEPAFPGCLVRARLIGVLLGEQTAKSGKGKPERNDRLIAVAEKSHLYGHIKDISQFEDTFLEELDDFFVNYHGLDGTKFKKLGIGGRAKARNCLKKAIRSANK